MENNANDISFFKIKFLKAYNGDCILITFRAKEQYRNILIDGGPGLTYENPKNQKGKPEAGILKETLIELKRKGEKIDLLILTHVDDDHIGGLLRWFEDDDKAVLAKDMVSEVWFNSGRLIFEYLNKGYPDGIKENHDAELILYKKVNPNEKNTSIRQGIEFSKLIKSYNIKRNNQALLKGMNCERMGLKFSFLSPDEKRLEKFLKEWKKKEPEKLTGAKKDDYYKPIDEFIKDDEFEEDTALPNGTSIAFLLTWHDKNFLFLADAHPSVIQESLESKKYSEKNKISCEIVKVAHHGSKANSSPDLLKLIDSKNYIISTNGDKDQHPHKQFLARLINLKKNCKIYFNYEERSENILKQPGDEKYRNILNKIDEKDFEYLL